MFGKITNLDKPMVLIKKFKEKIENRFDDEMMSIEDMHENKTKTEYIVQAIVRKKILFNKRPKPIVFWLYNEYDKNLENSEEKRKQKQKANLFNFRE